MFPETKQVSRHVVQASHLRGNELRIHTMSVGGGGGGGLGGVW